MALKAQKSPANSGTNSIQKKYIPKLELLQKQKRKFCLSSLF